jgi:hypothetical protein
LGPSMMRAQERGEFYQQREVAAEPEAMASA